MAAPPSPFPPSTSSPGGGHIVAKLLPVGETGLEKMAYQYPLKLINPPRPSEHQSVLVFLLSYGGGLVAGDSVRLRIDVHAGARLSVVTQGHTKVFKSPGPTVVTRQTLEVRVAADAALCLLPDPVQPFGESVYEQAQVFRLAETASLCILDWVTRGRTALGEDWSFARWTGRNEVWASPHSEMVREMGGGSAAFIDSEAVTPAAGMARLLVRDSVILDRDNAQLYTASLNETMRGLGVIGTLILRGPLVKSLSDFFLAEFSALPRLGARDFRTPEARQAEGDRMSPLEKWQRERQRMELENGILWSAANLRGCVVVKFGAPAVETGRHWIRTMLTREGSVAENFGLHALMCVR